MQSFNRSGSADGDFRPEFFERYFRNLSFDGRYRLTKQFLSGKTVSVYRGIVYIDYPGFRIGNEYRIYYVINEIGKIPHKTSATSVALMYVQNGNR
jgi:hypothetical protein